MRNWRNSTFLHSVRSSPSLLKYKQFASVLRLKALSEVRLPLQSPRDRVGFRPTAVSGFALLVILIVAVGRPTSKFGLRHWPSVL